MTIVGYAFSTTDLDPYWAQDEGLDAYGVWRPMLLNTPHRFKFGLNDTNVMVHLSSLEGLPVTFFLRCRYWVDGTYYLMRSPENNAGAWSGDFSGFLNQFAQLEGQLLAPKKIIWPRYLWWHLLKEDALL